MSLPKIFRTSAGNILLPAAYVLALGAFYWKYVPLVPGFQAVLLPILLAVAVLAAVDGRRGLLAFIFVFPLINNLPYFFGIAEPIPFAPTALVLFLFFFGGRLVAGLNRGNAPRIAEPILRPLGLAAALVAVSAVVTFWRYANFFPIGSGRVLEWAVNAHGVTSGGAFMSVLFCGLNYLTAFGFFFIFLRTDRSRAFLVKALTALGAGALLSCAFGFTQLAGHLALGNNPLSIVNEIVNATFKDALAFGCFLSMIIPLSLGSALSFRGLRRAGAVILLAASAILILAAGSKSAFFGALAGLMGFAGLAASTALRRRSGGARIAHERTSGRGAHLVGGTRAGSQVSVGRFVSLSPSRRAVLILAVVLAAAGAGILAVQTGVLRSFLSTKTIERLPKTRALLNLRINTLWRLAGDCITAYPATGVGVGAYIIESSNFAARDGGALTDLPESAENYFLQVAAELGLPGLAVFVWFIWEIFKKGRKAWRATLPRSPDRWLLAGTFSGLVSYAFNIMAHSYIGSFEIKYTFWLFVAAVFILDARNIPDEAGAKSPASKPGRGTRTAAAIAAVVFGAIFLWISTHALSLARTTDRFPIPREAGLGKVEKTESGREFRWTREYGGLTIRIDSPVLAVPIHAAHPDIRSRPVTVRISLAPDVFRRGRTLKELVLSSPEWSEVVLDVPAGEVGLRRFLFFEVARTWNPSKTTGAHDSRDLGIAIGPVQFR